MLADLHAIRLRLALLGASTNDLSAKISAIEQQPAIDNNDPSFTIGLVPVADKLLQELDEPHWGSAQRYAEQLAVQIHKQYEIYTEKPILSSKPGDIEERYFTLCTQLRDSLRKGGIAKAAALAVELQSAEDAILKTKRQPPLYSGNFYNINDALGRAAFLRKDYLTACDYLLKAADTPGKDPTLRSFGPDVWLARALLTAGYKDAVLAFLERCKAFWDNPILNQWITVLKDGGTPDLSKKVYSHDPIEPAIPN